MGCGHWGEGKDKGDTDKYQSAYMFGHFGEVQDEIQIKTCV